MSANNTTPHLSPILNRTAVCNEELEALMLYKLIFLHRDIDYAMSLLTPECFHSGFNPKLFEAAASLYNQGLEMTITSVSVELYKELSQEQVSLAISRIGQLAMNNEEYMETHRIILILKDYSKRRLLAPIAQQLTELSYGLSMPLEPTVFELQQRVDSIINETALSHFSTLEEQLAIVRQHIDDNDHPERRHTGILTSIPLLDQNGGLPPGLVVVAGKSSHGKTSFANFLALNAMRSGASVAYYSLEMDNLQLSQRLVAMESGVNANHLAHHPLSDEQKRQVDAAIERLKGSHAETFNFDERGISNLERMMQSIRSLKRSRGLDLVVVDYIQLLGIDREYRDENTAKLIGRAAHEMHNVGLSLGVTILCLSQLNRNVTGIPTRAHIRDSGEIDEAADATILIYRGAGDKLESYPAPFERIAVRNTVLVLLDKLRNGATGHCVMGFNPDLTLFQVLDETPERQESQSPSAPTNRQYSLEWVKGGGE